MLYFTVSAKNVKRTLIVLLIFTVSALLFCCWALIAHGNHKSSAPGQAVSSSEPASQSLITVVSLSDTSGTPSVSDASTAFDEQPAVPAYINLSPFSLSENIHLPLESAFVSSSFGFRDHPINGRYAFHSGLDLAASEGSPICAMLDGTVSLAEYDSGYGNYIIIDHEDGVQTLYAHCLTLLAQEGDIVTRGTQIAEVGATGSATGPHLHVELRYKGQRYDPTYILGDIYS